MNKDEFQFKQFTVAQEKGVFKVGTDGCLLGSMCSVHDRKTMLDVGCGTGLIALMYAQRNPETKIDAIDINTNAVSLAEANFRRSKWANRLTGSLSSINDLAISKNSAYDHIVSNPPFFEASLHNSNIQMAKARHEIAASLEEFIHACSALLTPHGLLSLILPMDRFETYQSIIRSEGMFVNRLITIQPFTNRASNRFIAEASFNNSDTHHEEFVLYKAQGELSEQSVHLLQPYYLQL